MSRSFSPTTVKSINSLETGNAFWFLVTIRHPDLPTPYRFVNNTVDVVSNGVTYVAYPFNITLAVDDGQSLPQVAVEFDNVDRELIDVVRGLTSAPLVDLQLILSNAPNIVEMSLIDMSLIDLDFDMQSISGNLISGDLLNASYPSDSYEPAQFPTLFY